MSTNLKHDWMTEKYVCVYTEVQQCKNMENTEQSINFYLWARLYLRSYTEVYKEREEQASFRKGSSEKYGSSVTNIQ